MDDFTHIACQALGRHSAREARLVILNIVDRSCERLCCRLEVLVGLERHRRCQSYVISQISIQSGTLAAVPNCSDGADHDYGGIKWLHRYATQFSAFDRSGSRAFHEHKRFCRLLRHTSQEAPHQPLMAACGWRALVARIASPLSGMATSDHSCKGDAPLGSVAR